MNYGEAYREREGYHVERTAAPERLLVTSCCGRSTGPSVVWLC